MCVSALLRLNLLASFALSALVSYVLPPVMRLTRDRGVSIHELRLRVDFRELSCPAHAQIKIYLFGCGWTDFVR